MHNLKIRLINKNDCHDVYTWRNNPYTKKMSLNSIPILSHDHNKWFSDMLESRNHYGFIGELENNKIGVVFLKKIGNLIIISINLNPHFRGLKLSKNLLSGSMDMFKNIKKESFIIEAKIRKMNLPSLRLFKKVGFHLYNVENDIFVYRYSLSFNKL